jgi:glycosyltransferase involved in cell wall biosynthesis
VSADANALAAGVPIVQTTNGWIRQMLQEHECGITVSATDVGGFADTLRHLATNPETTRVLGKNAQRLAKAHVDKRKLADQFLVEMIRCAGNAS